MRIITGSARGAKLKAPKGQNTRPTADRIKESLFNILGSFIYDKNVLDLFSGTGSLSLEALSRGANHAIMVDCSLDSISTIKFNATHTKLIDKSTILKADVFATIKKLRSNALPEILIDENECRNLCSAIMLSPLKKTEGRIELDKSSEKKVPLKNQAGLTTQLPSALIYLLFGRYGNKVLSELSSMPDNLPDNLAI